MDDAGGCFGALILVGMMVFCAAVIWSVADGAGYKRGYRRGLCEGRGGVEVTVGDSIRCIQPPQNVRVK